MLKDTARRIYFQRHKKADRRPYKIFPRDPMKKLLKRMTNTKLRQGGIAVDGAYYRRIVDIPWILY